ncbi:MAG: hypothetical protein LBM96_03315 [Methanobrevibacter sp.]|jgi:hypothetical protein|nr:hypothetical protein [Candidatus Methanoflexus mossambicus]
MLLYIFVEGDDDEQLFNNIIVPNLVLSAIVVKFSQASKVMINNLISEAKSKENMDYVFVCDYDSKNGYPCLTARKNHFLNEFRNLEENKMVIVDEEIESWYYCGINKNEKIFNDLNFNISPNCSKEEFLNLFSSNTYFKRTYRMEILKTFDFKKAYSTNESFKYFIHKLEMIINSNKLIPLKKLVNI